VAGTFLGLPGRALPCLGTLIYAAGEDLGEEHAVAKIERDPVGIHLGLVGRPLHDEGRLDTQLQRLERIES
jgi:hypothetical protein